MMKKTILVWVVAVLMVAGTAQAYVFDDFEDPNTAWTNYVDGGFTTLENSTEDPYVGNRSLKMVDSPGGYPYVQCTTNHSGLSALKDTYVELAIKLDNPACGWLGTNGVAVYLGNSNAQRTCWMVREVDIQSMAQSDPPADGWYVFHLELDPNGNSTMEGTMLNGVPVSDGVAWNSGGTVNWENVAFMAVLVFQASSMDNFTQYMDQVTLGEPAPVPEFCGDLGTVYHVADISGPNGQPDCYVDFYDFAAMAELWLGCTDPNNPDCW
ncbi:MAG: hypothetical protein ABIG61_07065 [Planctomycetota bacterium]